MKLSHWLLISISTLFFAAACSTEPTGNRAATNDVLVFNPDGGGVNGNSGTSGATGTDGVTGTQGADGITGTVGLTGLTTGTDATDSCVPACQGKTCGPDGCGGQCGACQGEDICDSNGVCTPHIKKECDVDTDCPAELPTCAPQGICIFCYPGTFQCQSDISYVCEQTGKFWEVADDCAAKGGTCNSVGGKCESGCGGGGSSVSKTNAGCDFYALDMRNAIDSQNPDLNAQDAQFAVSASNTSDKEATVTVTYPNGQESKQTIPANSLKTFLLPKDFGLNGTGKGGAYHVVSNQPITVYQFNPLSNEGVFSNDASVLLPTSGLGTTYRVVSREQLANTFQGYFSVVGVTGGTKVVVTPTTPTVAGDGIPALSIGQKYEFTINAGEAITFESSQPGGDLTGSLVTADKAIAVFSGHVAAVTSDACCADHLEQQMAPTTSWGKEYVVARSMERGNEKDYIRVIANDPLTQITVSPAVTNPATKVLNGGEFWEFTTDTHVRVTADKPIMVTQFLASSFESDACKTLKDCPPNYICDTSPLSLGGQPCFNDSDCPPGGEYVCKTGLIGSTCEKQQCIYQGATGFGLCFSDQECGPGHVCYSSQCSPIGDPALILAVPFEQWQTNYVFLTPDSYSKDYINLVTTPGAQVKLDNVPLSPNQFQPLAGSNYVVYRQGVTDGVHTLTSDKPVSIVVYGYDKDVSYGYPGGLGLQEL